jgi:hypothetical protein
VGEFGPLRRPARPGAGRRAPPDHQQPVRVLGAIHSSAGAARSLSSRGFQDFLTRENRPMTKKRPPPRHGTAPRSVILVGDDADIAFWLPKLLAARAAVRAANKMTVAAAAEAAGVSAQTMRNWARRVPIGVDDPITGVALIDRAALRAYLLERFGRLPAGLRAHS